MAKNMQKDAMCWQKWILRVNKKHVGSECVESVRGKAPEPPWYLAFISSTSSSSTTSQNRHQNHHHHHNPNKECVRKKKLQCGNPPNFSRHHNHQHHHPNNHYDVITTINIIMQESRLNSAQAIITALIVIIIVIMISWKILSNVYKTLNSNLGWPAQTYIILCVRWSLSSAGTCSIFIQSNHFWEFVFTQFRIFLGTFFAQTEVFLERKNADEAFRGGSNSIGGQSGFTIKIGLLTRWVLCCLWWKRWQWWCW